MRLMRSRSLYCTGTGISLRVPIFHVTIFGSHVVQNVPDTPPVTHVMDRATDAPVSTSRPVSLRTIPTSTIDLKP
jgi:hypothetical protein